MHKRDYIDKPLAGADVHTRRSWARTVKSRGIATVDLLFIGVFLMFYKAYVLLILVQLEAVDAVQ